MIHVVDRYELLLLENQKFSKFHIIEGFIHNLTLKLSFILQY